MKKFWLIFFFLFFVIVIFSFVLIKFYVGKEKCRFMLTKANNNLLFLGYQWAKGGNYFPFDGLSNCKLFNGNNKLKDFNCLINTKDEYSLIVFVKDVDCNLCIERINNLLKEIKNRNRYSIFFIISLREQMNEDFMVKRFLKVNKIEFPVFLDKKEGVFKELGIEKGPVIVLVDNTNKKILWIGLISPSTKELSEKFFVFLKRLAE